MTQLSAQSLSKNPLWIFAQIAIVLAILYAASLYNFLLFHSLGEIFSIVIAVGIFIVGWNSRKITANSFFLILGVSYLYVALIDMAHLLSYGGLSVIPENINLSTQLWLSSHYLETLALIGAFLFASRRVRPYMLFWSFFLLFGLIILALFYWKIFPAAFIAGVGFTKFKIISDYTIAVLFLLAIYFLLQKQEFFDQRITQLFVVALLAKISAQLFFVDSFDMHNYQALVRHMLRFSSFFLIYKAVLESGLMQPYQTMFRDLIEGEKALQESTKQYRSLVEYSPDAIAVHRGGKFIYINHEALKLLGAGKEEQLLGKNILDFIHHDYHAFITSLLKMDTQKEEGGGPRLLKETKIVTLGGKTKNIEVSAAPIMYQGEPAIQIAMRDISKRKEREKEISKLLKTIENAHEATHIDDAQGRITYTNRAFDELFGYRKGELIGKLPWILNTGSDEEAIKQMNDISEALKQNNVWEGEIRNKRKNGEEIITHCRISVHKDKDGKIINYLSTQHDITKRKKTEERMGHLASFPQLNPFPVLETDISGKITFYNPAASDLLVRLDLENPRVFLPTDIDGIIKSFLNGERTIVRREIKINSKIFAETISFVAEFNVMRVYAMDITERKQAEKSLKEAHSRLEEKVKERTLELANANKNLQTEIVKRKKSQEIIFASNRLLQLASQKNSRKEFLDETVKLIKEWSSCQYVGIRVLNTSGLIPYESHSGFPQNFWEKENILSIKTDVCACIRVVTQKPEPQDMPAMTARGSFCSNNAAKFVQGLTEEEKKRFRGTCVKQGFLSVGVIPIRYKEKIYGAIHLADTKENMLPPAKVNFLEFLTPVLGGAMDKLRAEEELHDHQLHLEKLVENRTKDLQTAYSENERKRKHIESLARKLTRDKELLRVILENTDTHLAYLDANFNFIWTNPTYAQGSGHHINELIGQNHFDLFPNEENKKIFEKVRDTAEAVEFKDKPFEFADQPWRGTTYWNWTLIPIKDERGLVVGLVFSLIDTTERKRAEEKMRIQKERLEHLTQDLIKFQLAVENSSDLIIITDPNDKIIYANKATEKITGYAPEELIGKTSKYWSDYMDMHTDPDFYGRVKKIIKEEKRVFVGELTNIKKSGEKYITQLHISPVLDGSGNIIFFVRVERDITQAKKIDKAKTEFISIASHQLRTPLTGISLSVEMLLSGTIGDLANDHKEQLQEVYRDAQGMAKLIETLLNVSRIEMGTLSLDLQPTNFSHMVDDIIRELSPQIQAKSIKLQKKCDLSISPIKVDRNLMRIALQNIISNAVKYTPTKGKIECDIKNDIFGAKIKITDTGYGIPKDQQDKVFTKMFRAYNVLEDGIEGTGLGLYIAKSVIEKHGGKIWFESPARQQPRPQAMAGGPMDKSPDIKYPGTSFYVEIPANVPVITAKEKVGSKV